MFLSQSEQNWLKHPIVDRSCWGSCHLYKSNQTVPFPKKCCPYYQTRYLQSLTRHMLLSGSFPTWFNLIVEKQHVILWIMGCSCHSKMVHFSCVVYSGCAIVLSWIVTPDRWMCFTDIWCRGTQVTSAWLKRVSVNVFKLFSSETKKWILTWGLNLLS